jgi:hypothetical protein
LSKLRDKIFVLSFAQLQLNTETFEVVMTVQAGRFRPAGPHLVSPGHLVCSPLWRLGCRTCERGEDKFASFIPHLSEDAFALFRLLHPRFDLVVVGHGQAATVRDPIHPRVILGTAHHNLQLNTTFRRTANFFYKR